MVGATGAVGIEILKTLDKRDFPIGQLSLLASSRSAGKEIRFKGQKLVLRELTEAALEGLDLVLLSAGGAIARRFAPSAVASGAIVIDNSSAFRNDPAVPLVVPEINAADIPLHRGILANPNCTTAITLMALYPLHQSFGVKRIFASSYQAVSGSGARAVEELRSQIDQITRSEPISKAVFPHQIAFNALPQIDDFLPSGYTKEEMKLQNEGRKIMHHPSFKASVTCVRVPVFRAHSVAISAEFDRKIDLDEARQCLIDAPGIDLIDAPERHEYPLPLQTSGKDHCEVGRLRKDCALENGLSFWVCGDQLLKGAALNAVQIAEALIQKSPDGSMIPKMQMKN